ncbi:myosin heavy chain, fast skeletal muscle-like [Trifolium pratense]|uniref:myosin heavy chain, fast skeletal muscle-like n=1 Tax=Trifolium pratense TaxID=57577 RepID=UPI001E693822|nr:myosin heavy chain, fast skeletal muscle-like [Trifolium pratense]
MVGGIDTTSIEPVRVGVSLFDDKGDSDKFLPARNKRDYEKEIEDLTKELDNYKTQLEAKHVAHIKALLKPEQNQKMIHELSTLLKNSDIERNKYMNECSEGKASKDELESTMKEMADLKLETAKLRDQLSHVLVELKASQRELLNKDTEIFAARDSESNAVTKAKQLENDLKLEKELKEELLHQVFELSEIIHRSKLAAVKTEKRNIGMLYQKDEKIQLATQDNDQAQQEMEDMRKHIDILHGLQNKQMVDEAHILSEDSNLLKNDIEQKERYMMDQSAYIYRLELELNQLKNELSSAKEEINELNISIESLISELRKAKDELKMNKERDIEAEVEIALLKSHLQECRSAYKNEYVTDHSKGEAEERNSEKNNDNITISLVKEAEKENGKGNHLELALMKKELENASLKISEMRTRAEQAMSRAELAENGKAALEEKIRRHREHRLRKKAALTALREESTPKPFTPSTSYGTPSIHQPLGKVLNMKL